MKSSALICTAQQHFSLHEFDHPQARPLGLAGSLRLVRSKCGHRSSRDPQQKSLWTLPGLHRLPGRGLR